jgi:D-3-phosphoglycerate dehydrogenase
LSGQKTGSHNVIGADRFFLTDEAIKNINASGLLIWANGKTEEDLVEKVRQTNAKVIISEYFTITDRVISASPNLKGIVVWGVGYDHVDVNAASEKGVYVANTRGSNSESVAEHVFAFILNLSRKLMQSDTFVRNGEWISREEAGLPHELTSHDLYQKTIGIVGFGYIGTLVARIAKGFNMRVLTYDPYVKAESAKEKNAELVDMQTLLRKSDFITLHVVLTEETRNLISTKELNLMKPTASLINASRGAVVDEAALIEALRNKKIAGACLDVFAKEPIDQSSSLLKFNNVIVTPHCAGNSEEALTTTAMMVSEETTRILRDEIPKNLVNRPQLLRKGILK